jgi:hypothetical protein
LTSFSAIVERPLFSPSRRPPAGANTAAGPLVASRYRLLGVLATGPKKRAFLADGVRRIDVAEGERLDGWTVKQIGADNLQLSSPDGDAVLTLKPAASADPPAKPQ